MTIDSSSHPDPDDDQVCPLPGRIVQLLPAQPGWCAVYNFGSEEDPDYRHQPIIGWALIDNPDGSQKICGFDSWSINLVDTVCDFMTSYHLTARCLYHLTSDDLSDPNSCAREDNNDG